MTDEEIDSIHYGIDFLLRKSMFSLLNKLLNPLLHESSKKEDPDYILTILTTTLPAKSKLPNRTKFVEIGKRILTEEEMKGLE